jgi:pSer/pThr/pTyr-binding forkhead associated (FHA) protein
MKRPPEIIVQLIHISGPMKGKIQEFSESRILIGRHPSCQLHFPPDLTHISRKHAEILRDGNQFKLIDHSSNDTFINGEKTKEAYLKNGDILVFSEGGPKVSFLTQRKERVEMEDTPPPSPPREEMKARPRPPLDSNPPVAQPQTAKPGEITIQPVKIPLSIQCGPMIRAFKELPVTIGKSPKCDMILDHPAIFDHHAQIFFSQNQYWLKDMTGQKSVQINRQPIGFQAPLKPNDDLALSPQGPVFRFLGEGRFAEVEESPGGESMKPVDKRAKPKTPGEKGTKGLFSKFKKLKDT